MATNNLAQQIRDAGKARIEALQAAGYVPAPITPDWKPKVPLSDYDQQTLGIPNENNEPWDYKTSKTNRAGDPLPNGAQGWTPNGDAYYGGSGPLDEWLKGLGSRLSAPTATPEYGDWIRPADELSAKADEALAGGDIWGGLATAASAVITRVAGAVGDAGEFLGNAIGASAEGEAPSVAQTIGRGASELVGGLLGGAQQFGEWFEQVRGGIREVSAMDGQEFSPLSSEIANLNAPEWFKSFLFAANVVGIAGEIGNAATAFIKNPEEAGKTFSEGFEAGRILYTTFKDPAIKAEYMRRMRAGESPYLLAEELQDPTSEMFGELIADPLNFVGWIAKGARLNKWNIASKASLTEFADEAIELGIRQIDNVADDAAAAVAKTDLTANVLRVADETRNGISKVDTRLKALTPQSKRLDLAQRTGYLFKTAAVQYGGKNPDDLLDFAEALARLHGDATSVEKAMSIIRKSPIPANVSLSKTGFELGYVIREMMTVDGKLAPKLFMDKLKSAKSAEELLNFFGKNVDDAVNKLVPKVGDAEDLGTVGRVVKAADKITGSGVYTGAKSFYGNLFFGPNPGYAVKAGTTDFLHLFVDDPKAALVHLKNRIFSPGATDDYLTKIYGEVPDVVKSATGPAGVKIWGAGKYAAGMQTNMARTLFAKGVKDSLRKARDVIFRTGTDAVKSAGGSDDLVRFMRRTLDETHDFNRVAEEALKLTDDGYMDAFSTLAWMDDVRYGILDDFNYLDRYKEALRAVEPNDLEGAVRAHNEFFEGIEEYAKEAAKVPVGMPPEIVDEAAASIMEAGGKNLIAESTQQLATIQKNTNYAAQTGWSEAVSITLSRARELGVDIQGVLDKKPQLRWAVSDNFLKSSGDNFTKWSEAKHAVYRALENGKLDVESAWKTMGFKGDMPATMTAERLKRYFYSGLYYPTSRQYFKQVRDAYVGVADEFLKEMKKLDPRLVDDATVRKAVTDTVEAVKWDNAAIANNGLGAAGSQKSAIYALADLNGIATAGKGGAPIKNIIRDTVRKYLPEAEKYADDAVVPYDVAQRAFEARAAELGEEFIPLPDTIPVMSAPVAADLIPPLAQTQDGAVFGARVVSEQIDGFRRMRVDLEAAMKRGFGQQVPISSNPRLREAITDFAKEGAKREFEAKLIAGRTAQAMRDFAFLPYEAGKTNFDTILSVIYPYHFWHTRTYTNWFKRIASDPQVVAAYAKYRDTMAEIHADAPEWWKWNINLDELLGLQSENPIFFNLEAALNPLNGMIGVDFNDPDKRLNWWTSALDDMGKWGPSPWPFFQIAAALALKMQGEDEAAAKWAGRLFPQSQTIEAAISFTGTEDVVRGLGLDPYALDPFTHLFAGGVDPYAAARAGRALNTMVLNGQITEDQAIDAAYNRTGQHWNDAMKLANSERAPGQLMSFFLGAGYRARSIGDMEADKFDAEYRRLYTLRRGGSISPQQFSEAMNDIRDRYPFMDSLLLARKNSEERDAVLAWNVMRRLPPSGGEIAQAAGISQDLLSKWYDTQGDWSSWSESDKSRFMAGVVDMRAILATPDQATRDEWDIVRSRYSLLNTRMEQLYGEDINNQISRYFQIKGESGQDAARLFLQSNPAVEAALDYKAQATIADPLLTAYYGGIEEIVRYYTGVMYDEAEKLFGSDVFAAQDAYWNIRDNIGSAEARKYLNQHPEIRRYWSFKESYERDVIFSQVAGLASKLPETRPATARLDAEVLSSGQEGVLAQLAQPQQGIPPEVIINALGQEAFALVVDRVMFGQPLPSVVQRKIEQIAAQAGITEFELLTLIEGSLGQ